MGVPGIVQHQYHTRVAGAMPQLRFQKGLERGVHRADELAGAQTDGPEARDRLAGGRMEQDWILDLWWHPHPASGARLLEVSFVHAPEFNALAPCQAM